jgi:ubiquitin
MNKPDSMAKNIPKIAEVKLSTCGFKVADLKKTAIAGLQSCGATFL